MNATKRRIALLLELPADSPDSLGMIALRRLLKTLLRVYGLRCISIKEPSDTVTFKDSDVPAVPK